MLKNIAAIFCLFLFCTCNKGNDGNGNPPEDDYKMEIVSGNNQWDTLGHVLQDSIIVRVTKNNVPVSFQYISVIKPSCIFLQDATLRTNANGLAAYAWQLNGKQGDQTVKFLLRDTAFIITDSVTAHAEGRFFTKAWQLANCLPNAGVNDICASGTGRIFCAMGSFDYPYYSDDNAKTWQRLLSFPLNNKEIRQIVANGNEVYIASRHDGIYYSPNNGTTWENRSSGITDKREVYHMEITKTGKLFLSTSYKPLHISSDKGMNWTEVPYAIINEPMRCVSEAANGDLYMASIHRTMYKSVNGGSSWTKVTNFPYSEVQSFFIDDNGDFYSGLSGTEATIYKSSNAGATWTLKYTSPKVAASNLGVAEIYKVNGFYYIMISGYGIVRTTDFSAYEVLTNMYKTTYNVSPANIILLPDMFDGLWYYANQ